MIFLHPVMYCCLTVTFIFLFFLLFSLRFVEYLFRVCRKRFIDGCSTGKGSCRLRLPNKASLDWRQWLQLQVKMENTTSETTKKVRNHMPQDLALLIMSKLPLKSLKRFGCVCKSWDLNFENPYFMSIFRKSFISNHISYYDGTSLLLSMTSINENFILLYSLFGEKFENKHKLDWPNHFPDNHDFDILDSGNFTGTLCLYRRDEENVLWNPSTKEFKVIPLSPYLPPYANSVVILHGFGFDYVRDDYKVLRHVDFFPLTDQHVNDLGVLWEDLLDKQISLDPFWEIYSLRSNSWRKLDSDAPYCGMCGHVGSGERLNTEGMCHWWASEIVNEKDWCILSSFDLRNEVFITTPITSDIDDHSWMHLVLLNGSIAVISFCYSTPTFHISVLGELGVKESWTKLFIVGPLASIQEPIGAGKNGDLFFSKEDGEIVWFDLSTQTTHELGIKGSGSHVLIYKERLIPMEGINN